MLRKGNTSGAVDAAAIVAAVAAEVPDVEDIALACDEALGNYGVATVDSLSSIPAPPSAGTIAAAVAALTVPALTRVEALGVAAPSTAINISGTAGQVIRVYAMHVYSGTDGVFSHSGSALASDIGVKGHIFKAGGPVPLYTMADGEAFTLNCDEGGLSVEVWYTQG